MKKITLMVAVLAMGLFFVSCNKEGQFNPKNKIDRIGLSATVNYEVLSNNVWTNQGTQEISRYASEIWNWDGKLLKSISHYNTAGELSYTENYEYDGNRLSKIQWGNSWYYTFEYEKGKISTIDEYNGTEKKVSYVFTHEKGKISRITVTNYDASKGASEPMPMNAFRFFIPNANFEAFMEMMGKMYSEMNTKSIETWTIDFEWDGKNIKKMTYLSGNYTAKYNYEYDNKYNPYCGLFDISDYDYGMVMSKNNITRLVADNSNNEHVERNYVYTYDGKVPEMQTCTYNETVSSSEREVYTVIHYYEYK